VRSAAQCFFRLRLLLTDNARCAFQQPAFPRRDLIGVDVELLRQLRQRLLTPIYRTMDILGGRAVSATAKLFMHRRSQAVSLPENCRFEGKEVRVTKIGDKVILEPLREGPFDVEAWYARLDALGAREFLPDGPPQDPPSAPDPGTFDELRPSARPCRG
jgi:antitoxin VapB